MKPKERKKDKTFHYTNEKMVIDLMKLIPFDINDVVLDAGSGKNKVWYKNTPKHCLKLECEIEDNCDFFNYYGDIDWIIGNPPFHESWKFFNKASELAKKGIAFLINNQALNSWTPKRYQTFKDRGFYLQGIHIVLDSRWFGRYYFMIFTKKPNNFITWNTQTYDKR